MSGNVFGNPHASSSAPYPQELNPLCTTIEEPLHSSTVDRQPKIQSSSVDETLQRIMEQTNNDCRFLISTLTSSLHQQEAMQWIKEVELVDSVDELRSSSSTRGISMPNFEVLDARIASALNISHFKRKISLEEQKAQKQDRFLRGRQIAYLIYEYFRVIGSQRFCRKLRRPVHYYSSK